jgi:hypothetical protein
MRNKKAKTLRKLAERDTIGKSEKYTRKYYRRLKTKYKQIKGQL